MLIFKKEFFEQVVRQGKRELPNECCGIFAGKEGRVEKVYEMTNTDKSPSTFFMDPKEQLRVMKEIRNLGLEMIGIYHSHVASPAYPSGRDIELAFYPEVSYVIISLRDKDNPEIRSFKIREGKIEEEKVIVRKNILFVCVENSCRSQMAEAMVNNLYWQKYFAYSAGSKPSGKVDSLAIEVMREIGIDISHQRSKGFDEVKNIEFDYVITLGCGDICPVYPAKHRIDWQINDPKGKSIEFFRKIRDDIHKKIRELIA
ncbi:MAG: Mov34/MPN/PAD-1 family protein [Candidatus Omnitrophica bacterium]|nr:Mov34/MPN/PAD-1 family protein [Candidatus Omnitrophota bacterium]MCM8793250.1 Mov34/MPN/PAD-1 family protein [Candidatus Omnitrophota bacterium]